MKETEALVVWGGWEGHEPELVGQLFGDILFEAGISTEITDNLDWFANAKDMESLRLIVPVVTMSTISDSQLAGVTEAVRERGVGLAGCHGGMCDSFRTSTEWQFMTGGQWVAHPGNDTVRYKVNFVRGKDHCITEGLEDFEVTSEQYYLHVDPGVKVLATTEFPHPKVDGPHTANPCRMPQVWTKSYGKGKVFYCALGHQRNVIESGIPRELMRRGLLWAAR